MPTAERIWILRTSTVRSWCVDSVITRFWGNWREQVQSRASSMVRMVLNRQVITIPLSRDKTVWNQEIACLPQGKITLNHAFKWKKLRFWDPIIVLNVQSSCQSISLRWLSLPVSNRLSNNHNKNQLQNSSRCNRRCLSLKLPHREQDNLRNLNQT